ncbi:hypothetical protein [Nitrosomonas communis]|uniref:hypothetical protein n=1 Tax=Nitrosomonas communis TaxID=44574 RepID=UPI0035290C6E
MFAIVRRQTSDDRRPPTTACRKKLVPLDALHEWLLQTRTQAANGGDSTKALGYTLKRCPGLIGYAQSVSLSINNNPV